MALNPSNSSSLEQLALKGLNARSDHGRKANAALTIGHKESDDDEIAYFTVR